MDERGCMLDVVLAPGRDRSVRRRHPWLLSGAVAHVSGDPAPGDWVRVVSAEGEALGFGHFAPASQIRVRLLAFGKEPPGDACLADRIAVASARRAADPLLAGTDAVRLANAEGDGLPGLVVDRYADALVVRCSGAGMSARAPLVTQALREATGARSGFRRDDAAAARRDGFEPVQQVLWGPTPPRPLVVRERGRRYEIDLEHGQKTGFYLDQRDARDLVQRLAPGRRVLDLFSYTGGFAVAAALGGASSVTLVDSSASALATARRNFAANAIAIEPRLVEGDGFQFVRRDDAGYDLLVLDPPPLARRKSDVARASRAHKDLLLHALRRAMPGAFILAFSCSHAIDATLFRQIAFGACLDAGRDAQVIATLSAPSDHPVSIDHPEGTYLSGLVLRV
ncbi:MAG: class I SAM-dependent rRNA methyltransferase [Deltaproteobacteria bacterium]|nr:class I SAM-dependent rRNA methyltransferase [Deltaproteobacteria bacterium]